jgi:hypothetical protein
MTNVGKVAMAYLLLGGLCIAAVAYGDLRGELMPYTQIYGAVFFFLSGGFFVIDREIQKLKRMINDK